MSLFDAAQALDDLAAGRRPERATLLAGALALSALVNRRLADQDLLDAAAGLNAAATGDPLALDAAGRDRAAVLAIAVRAAAASNIVT